MPPGPKVLFERTIAAHAELMSSPPVDRESFLASILGIENAGQVAIGTKSSGIDKQTAGEAVLTAIGDEESRAVIQPPLNANQLRLITGKLAIWTAASIAGVEEAPGPTQVDPGAASKRKS